MKRKIVILLLGALVVLQMTGCTTALRLLGNNKESGATVQHTPEPESNTAELPTPESETSAEDDPAVVQSTTTPEPTPEPTATPEPTPEPVDEIEAWAQSIAAAASENSGIPLEMTSGGSGAKMALYIYSAPGGTTLSISYDVELDRPEKISVSLGALEPTEEWIALKDGVLSVDFLGMDPELIGKYYGNCGFKYGSPEIVGENGISVLVGQVNSCVMMIQWIEE